MEGLEKVINWMFENEHTVRVLSTYVIAFTSIVGLAAALIALIFDAFIRRKITPLRRTVYTAAAVFVAVSILLLAGVTYRAWTNQTTAIAKTKTERIEDLVRNRDFSEALTSLEALDKSERGPKTEVLTCEIYVETGRVQDAIKICSDVLVKSPNTEHEASARYWLGRAKLLSGNATEAKELFQLILDDRPNDMPALAGRCDAYLQLGDFGRSYADCTRVIDLARGLSGDLAPDNIVARAMSTRCAVAFESNLADRPDDRIDINRSSVDDCNAAVTTNDQSPAALLRACFATLEFGRDRGGKPSMQFCAASEAALASDPGFPRDRLYAVQCFGHRVRGEPTAALPRCEMVARNHDGSRGFFVEKELCAVRINLRDFTAASGHCNAAIEADQRVADVWNSRCIANFWRDDLTAAAYDCQHALDLRKSFALAHKNLCRVLYWQGLFPEALASCTEAQKVGLGPITTPEALAYVCNAKIEIGTKAGLTVAPPECEQATIQFSKQMQPSGLAFALLGHCRAQAIDAARKRDAENTCSRGIQTLVACQAYDPIKEFDTWKDTCPSGNILNRILAQLYLERGKLLRERQALEDANKDLDAARALGERDRWIKDRTIPLKARTASTPSTNNAIAARRPLSAKSAAAPLPH